MRCIHVVPCSGSLFLLVVRSIASRGYAIICFSSLLLIGTGTVSSGGNTMNKRAVNILGVELTATLMSNVGHVLKSQTCALAQPQDRTVPGLGPTAALGPALQIWLQAHSALLPHTLGGS